MTGNDRWLESVASHPGALLFTLDPEGRLVWASPQAETLLGWKPGQRAGQSVLDALTAARGEAEGHRQAKADGREDAAHHEVRLKDRRGAPVWLDVVTRAERGVDGRLVAVHGMGVDVTERHRAREALERSRRRLEAFIEEAPDMIYVHDLTGRFLSMNPAGLRLYGYTQEEMLRLSVRDLVDPAHLSRAAEQMRLKAEGRSRRSLPYELLTRTKSGRPVWVEVSSTAVADPDGRAVAIQGIARNINERKANEAALRVVQRVAFAASESDDLAGTLGAALAGLAEATQCARVEGWVLGADGRLHLASSWPEERGIQAEKFDRLSAKTTFGLGEGISGRAWAARCPVWVPDLDQEPSFLRASAARAAGYRGLLAVPISAAGQPVALALFFTGDDEPAGAADEPPAWQTLVETITSQVGSLLAHRQEHDALARQAAVLGLQLDQAPVGVLLIGRDGTLLGANRRFQELCEVAEPVAATPLDGSFLRRMPADVAARFAARARELYEAERLGAADERAFGDRVLRRFVADLPGPDGVALARAVYLRDVTEQRHAEELLRAR